MHEAINNKIWLASYPRSGNTFLRTILWQCFGLRSGSIYPNDLGGNRRLEDYVGHVECGPDRPAAVPDQGITFLKTHEHAQDEHPAIYVLRDGRAAAVSLQAFYWQTLTIEAVVEGHHQFGTWSAHVESWHPWNRPNTLLLRYEQMKTDLPATLRSISGFIQREVLNARLPDREAIAEVDGLWVTKEARRKPVLAGEALARFNTLNRRILGQAGYAVHPWTVLAAGRLRAAGPVREHLSMLPEQVPGDPDRVNPGSRR